VNDWGWREVPDEGDVRTSRAFPADLDEFGNKVPVEGGIKWGGEGEIGALAYRQLDMHNGPSVWGELKAGVAGEAMGRARGESRQETRTVGARCAETLAKRPTQPTRRWPAPAVPCENKGLALFHLFGGVPGRRA
jgi:hypothetical protein